MQKKETPRFKRILRKSLKIVLWIFVSIISIFLLLALSLQIPAVQNFAKNKAVDYLESKIKTKVVIGRIELGLPKKVILEGVYFEDQKKDTLLAGEKLAVDISLFELFNNKVELNSVDLKGITAYIQKDDKGVFNFDYIIKAFASKEKKVDDSPPMQFSIDKVNLDRVKLRYMDATSSDDLAFFVNHFDTRIKTFDLDNMDFEAGTITIDGVNLTLRKGIVEAVENIKDVVSEKQVKENKILKIKLGDVDLSKINIDFEDEKSKLKTAVKLQKLSATFETIDLAKGVLSLKKLEVADTKGSLALGKLDKQLIKNDPTTVSPANSWKIQVQEIDLKNVDFKFDDFNKPITAKGIDYAHMDLKKINLEATDLKYSAQSSSGNIAAFAVQEKSGLVVQNLKTDFTYTDKGASLKNLYVKTPQTLLKKEIIVSYPSLQSLQKNPGDITVSANLSNSKIGFKDVLLFVPTLKNTDPFKTNPNAVLDINSVVSGKLNNISIPKLEISGIGSTKVAASGRVIGLPDMEKAYFDLNIKNLQSTSKDVSQFVPKGTIPTNIQLPNQFATKGTFKGTIKNFITDLNLTSSFGNAKVNARFDRLTKNQERYDAKAQLDNFDVGKLIKNDSIGKISLRANIKGVGLNPKTANAIVDGTIIKAGFNGYTYTNLNLDGKINRGLFEVKADTKDPNLTFTLAANGSFRDKYPSGKLKLNIDIADLNKLNLHAGPMKIRGDVDADIQSADLDYLNGKIIASKFLIATDKEQFPLDSIAITATTTAEKSIILLKSQFADATIDGKFKLSKVSTAIQSSIAKYYDFNNGKQKLKSEQQQFAFNVNVKDNRILMKVLPKLKSLEPIKIAGRYNSVGDSIVVNGSIPKLIYGETDITGANLAINTQENALNYALIIGNLKQGTMELAATSLSGKASNNVLDYTLQLKDLKGTERYLIAGTLQSKNGGNEVNLNPANLILNYEKWNLSEQNLIRFGDGIYANNFELSKDGSSIKIQSLNTQNNAPVEVTFANFDIQTLTNLAQKSDFAMTGKINGEAIIKNLQSSPVFTSDLTISDFTFQKEAVGNLKVQVNNETANVYAAKIALEGLDNQLNLDGNYNASSSSFDLNLAIEKLQMKSLQAFTFGNLKESNGFLSGDLKITGKATQPNIQGDLKFNDVSFTATKLNSKFKMMNDRIAFSGSKIALDNFKIKDENENDLTLNGTINSEDYANLGFDLRLDADNFKAVNSKEKDNKDFYGILYLDNHLRIKGDMNNPVVDGTIRINKDTKFTIVLPQDDPSIADRDGIVEFIDQDQPKLFTTVAVDEALSQTAIKGINASVNIEIDEEAELSLIIDKANGDFLKLKGEAQLTGGIDASGKTTLTGRYELTEGSYDMSFNLIKRKFDIKKGSYILWTGEPTLAEINITAVYKTETAPINLLENQLSNLTAEERNTYKERIPFETELKMTGALLKPDISFDIVLPEGNNSVSAEIIDATNVKLAQLRQDPNELNKQVFALLLLNRFVGENPFASETGGITASAFARDSASKVLSQQLNNLASDLIKGFELNFDVNSYEDYTTGQKDDRTDLNVGLSKRLLNDRLKVTVGSSFGIEGEKQENQQMNNIAGDIAGEYQLSKDGRYKIRAYRKNRYQVALQGQVIESGLGFIITIDYNQWKEIFNKSKKDEMKKNAVVAPAKTKSNE